ncbi:DUF6912 family protein [Mariniluteicoccus flavus]
MVFVPVSSEELAGWVGAAYAPDGPAYSATPGLLALFGFDASEDEEADHAALVLASLACVRRGLPRLVVAAEVASLPDAARDDGRVPGEVTVGRVPWRDVRAVFVDDPDDAPTPETFELALGGDLSALDPHPLLWFAPSEVDQLPPLSRPETPGA